MTLSEIRKEITNSLNEVLIPNGFQLYKRDSNYCYEKITEFGNNKVWLIFNSYPSLFFVSVFKSLFKFSCLEIRLLIS